MAYLKRQNPKRLPQWAPLPGQVQNSEVGHAWPVDDWTRLRRFLILGSEGGSYYASEWKLTRENAEAVERAVRADGKRAVDEIVAVSRAARAPKNEPALFALALAAGVGDDETRKAALQALP
jgi:60 kDa SS-A/Ro ribonucleoprotein